MTVEELIIYGKQNVHSMHAKLLLADLLKTSPLNLPLLLNDKVPIEKETLYKKEIEALKESKPLQYVLGSVNFYGLNFFVNEDVLIPRFETEGLVEAVLSYIDKREKKNLKVLDLGTGSGVIGLTLKKLRPSIEVTLVDVSTKALQVAKKNRQELNIEAELVQSDWLENVKKDSYDIIVSNPPYIKTTETIEKIVKDNEPHLALYAGEEGLDCYNKIIENISSFLGPQSLLAFEIGQTQGDILAEKVKAVLQPRKIEVKKDLQGRNRYLFVYFKND